MGYFLPVAILLSAALERSAQTATPVTRAAETITARDVGHHIGVIAADSMRGRNTPSPGLELTARYVADRFKAFGLKPGGDGGGWLQRYPHPRDSTVTAPNTVGILEGSDPKLKHEYIVLSAHMDHLGVGQGFGMEGRFGRPAQPPDDSIYNGADDDASGVAGILELAEAFSHLGVRPRRSIVFLTVSGEEKGRWGSEYFADHPPVPLQQIVANVNFDMIGRWTTDTVLVIGLEHSDLGAVFDRVKTRYPETAIASIPNPPLARLKSSDHYSFARRGVPILKFGGPNAGSTDYHLATDAPEKIEAEREVRILRFAFYLVQDVANAEQRPQWNPESYKTIVNKP